MTWLRELVFWFGSLLAVLGILCGVIGFSWLFIHITNDFPQARHLILGSIGSFFLGVFILTSKYATTLPDRRPPSPAERETPSSPPSRRRHPRHRGQNGS
jgi:hypothetical protein